MNKRYITFWLAFIFISSVSFAQQTLFERSYGGSSTENSYGIEPTLDGGFITVGYTTSYGSGKKDAYLVKTNGIGQIVWSKSYGSTGDEVGWAVAPTSDSGFVVAGTTNSYRSGNADALIFKTDKNGNVVWTRTIGGDSIEDGYNVIRSIYSNGFYVTGYVKNDTTGTDAFIAKLGAGGNVRWYRKFGSLGDDEAYGIAEDLKGDVVICGMTLYDSLVQAGTTTGIGTSDAFIAKFDSVGSYKWMRTLGSNYDDVAWDVKVDKNKYILTGWTKAVNGGDNDILFVTTDTSGAVTSASAYGGSGNDRGFNLVVKTGATNTYAVVGYGENSGSRDVVFAEFFANGNVANFNMLGASGTDGHWPTDIALTRDGGFAVLSMSNSFGSSEDMYLIKLSDKGEAQCNSSTDVFMNMPINLQSVYFGIVQNFTPSSQTPGVTRTDISSNSVDTTHCCKLSAALTKTSYDLCKGSSTSIGRNRTTGVNYTWYNASGSVVSTVSNPTVSPTASTTYKLVVTSSDQACAPDSTVVTVNVKQLLTEDWARDTTFCTGDSVFVAGSNNLISYNWVGKTVNSNNKTIKLKQSDTIYFTGIDVNSCGYKDTMVVTAFGLPVFDLGADTTICDNQFATFKGPANMTSYSWNNGQGTSRTYMTNVVKTHKLDVVDQNGCKYSDTKTLFTKPSSEFSLGPDTTFCDGAGFTIEGPGALSGYIWNDTASSMQNIVVYKSGSYHLTAYNSFGCPSFDTVVLTTINKPSINLGADFNLCFGTTKYLVGPKNMTAYKWNDGSTNDSLKINTSGNYWLKITDVNGCNNADSINVGLVNPPTITLGNDTIATAGDSVRLSPGSGFASYKWNTNETTSFIYVKTDGTYSVTVTDNNGCTASANRKVQFIVGIDDLKLSGFKYYPVPVNDMLTLEFSSLKADELWVEIFDITGRKVMEQSFETHVGNNNHSLNVSRLKSGNYMMILHNSNGATPLKLVKE
ncbi:MAG: T9SS type A sorting domain-containing protein [Flavobacteriales bacterium]|nr:T9SS type A sorting domain-containing protein [Flavobacteriales bacterium]